MAVAGGGVAMEWMCCGEVGSDRRQTCGHFDMERKSRNYSIYHLLLITSKYISTWETKSLNNKKGTAKSSR